MNWTEIEKFNIDENKMYLTCNDVGGVFTVKGVVIVKQNMCNKERESAGLKGLNYTHIMPIPELPVKAI